MTAAAQARRPPLRVAVAVESLHVPQWIALVVSQLEQAEFVDLALLVGERNRPRRRLRERLSGFAYELYERSEHRLLRAANDAFAPADLRATAPDVDVAEISDDAGAAALNGFDVVLQVGGAPLPASAARYGVWSLHHGDPTRYRGGPPLFWEIYERDPVSATALLARADGVAGERIVYCSYSATDAVSLYRNRNAAYWKAAHFPLRCLRRLYDGRLRPIADLPPAAVQDRARDYRTPSNLQMLAYVLRVAATTAARKLSHRFFDEQWFVAYRPRSAEADLPEDLRDMEIVVPPSDRFYADPFVVGTNGRHFLFFEDYSYADRRGQIVFVELSPNRDDTRPRLALARPYHVSYPLVFWWDGGAYMLPETAANRTIELYRADRFPDRWSLAAVLLDEIVAYDATLLHHEETFWLFANVPVMGARIADELSLFFADSLFGPWTPHPLNPIVSDVRRARPAGPLFRRNAQLIRPSQDSALGYGHSVVFNRIEVLTRTEYSERPVARLDPGWLRGNLRTHTYSADGAYEAVDGRFRSPRLLPRLSRRRS